MKKKKKKKERKKERKRYLGINLPKDTRDLYAKIYKTLVKKKSKAAQTVGEIYLKMTILSMEIYRYSAVPSKQPIIFFHRTRTTTTKSHDFHGNTKDSKQSKQS